MDTFHTETESKIPGSVSVMRANGWLVVLTCGDGHFQYEHTTEWREALDWYDDPPTKVAAFQSVAICPCINGVPGERLAAHTIADLRRET